ncbi:hypothetical protein WH50_18185 [Pokkaliibacter plantistimulans]|uniref:Uncharacterized protein n=1 Tax=Pokkaliibacter plantistimulans TaxID=1635171 RepID=A0ABX5LTB0_9GAMM|nr:hypothetical protein WH50_18185 [Pokkaliibacter plantistimulans]
MREAQQDLLNKIAPRCCFISAFFISAFFISAFHQSSVIRAVSSEQCHQHFPSEMPLSTGS